MQSCPAQVDLGSSGSSCVGSEVEPGPPEEGVPLRFSSPRLTSLGDVEGLDGGRWQALPVRGDDGQQNGVPQHDRDPLDAEVPQLASDSNPSDADASGVALQADSGTSPSLDLASDGNSDSDVDMGMQPQQAMLPGRGGLPPAIGQLEDAFRWPTVALQSLSKLLKPSNVRRSLLGHPLITSSHFLALGRLRWLQACCAKLRRILCHCSRGASHSYARETYLVVEHCQGGSWSVVFVSTF